MKVHRSEHQRKSGKGAGIGRCCSGYFIGSNVFLSSRCFRIFSTKQQLFFYLLHLYLICVHTFHCLIQLSLLPSNRSSKYMEILKRVLKNTKADKTQQIFIPSIYENCLHRLGETQLLKGDPIFYTVTLTQITKRSLLDSLLILITRKKTNLFAAISLNLSNTYKY